MYEGFRDVFIPGLPDEDAIEEAARVKFMQEQELKKEIEAQEREDHRLFDE